MSIRGQPANLTHLNPRGIDPSALQIQPTNPFPTFWRTAEGTATLVNLLPKDHQEIFQLLDASQRSGQLCSLPHVPDECTEFEVQRFLTNLEENSEHHPDMLALLFAKLAQGIQNGVYNKYGGSWHAGAMEADSRLGNAFSSSSMHSFAMNTVELKSSSCRVIPMSKTRFILEPAQAFNSRNASGTWPLSD